MKILGYLVVFSCICIVPKINWPVIVFMFPCYAVGFEVHRYKEKFTSKMIYAVNGMSFLGFIFMMMYFNTSHYIYTSGIDPITSSHGFWSQIGINIFRWGVAALGSVAMLEILKNMYQGFEKGKIIYFFRYLGTISLEIYVIQKILVETLLSEFMMRLGIVNAEGGG